VIPLLVPLLCLVPLGCEPLDPGSASLPRPRAPAPLAGRGPAGALPTRAPATAPRASADEVEEIHGRAVAHYERGEYREALDLFERALALAPEEPAIRVSLGRTLVALAAQLLEGSEGADSRILDRASSLLRRALLHWEGDAATYELIALCALRQERLDEAERALATAVERDPTAARAWRLLGVVRDRRGRTAEAIEALERAMELRPEDAETARRLRRLRSDREITATGRPLESARFRVFVPSAISLEGARGVVDRLEATSAELERRWGSEPPRGVEVILYPPGEFSLRTGFAEEAGGAFDGRIRIAFPDELAAGGLTLEQVIRHETAHLLLHRLPGSLPRWLDEGLAQLADGGERGDWLERFRAQGGGAAEIGLAARERALERDRAESWAGLYLHSYLFLRDLEERHGRFRLDLVVRRLARGDGIDAAFVEVYGSSPAELDRGWRRGLRAGEAGGSSGSGAGPGPAPGAPPAPERGLKGGGGGTR